MAEDAGGSRSLPRRVVAGAVFGAIVYAVLAFAADARSLVNAFRGIPWHVVPLVLGLASVNYLLRFEKWHYFIGRLGLAIPRASSLVVFLCGLVMSITPGKMGEVLKSYLLKQIHGAPMSVTAPAVMVERLTDLVALILLAAAGGFVLTGGAAPLGIGVALTVVIVGVVSSERLCRALTGRLASVKRLEPAAAKVDTSLKSARALVRPVPLVLSSLISVPAWFCECVGFFLIVKALGYETLGLLRLTGIYALAAVVGAVSMLPGGLGATELTLAGMLRGAGVPRSEAVAATLLVRVATLWYAVAVGAVFLAALRYGLGRSRIASLEEGAS